jgi:hypothetical protein
MSIGNLPWLQNLQKADPIVRTAPEATAENPATPLIGEQAVDPGVSMQGLANIMQQGAAPTGYFNQAESPYARYLPQGDNRLAMPGMAQPQSAPHPAPTPAPAPAPQEQPEQQEAPQQMSPWRRRFLFSGLNGDYQTRRQRWLDR